MSYLPVEEGYTFHSDHVGQTVLAFVSRNRDDLAREFHEWRPKQASAATSSIWEELLIFEEMRFGKQLYPAPHGVLVHAVECLREGTRRKLGDPHWPNEAQRQDLLYAAYNTKRQKGQGTLDYVHTLAVEGGLIKPEAPPPAKDFPPLKPHEQATLDADAPDAEKEPPTPELPEDRVDIEDLDWLDD